MPGVTLSYYTGMSVEQFAECVQRELITNCLERFHIKQPCVKFDILANHANEGSLVKGLSVFVDPFYYQCSHYMWLITTIPAEDTEQKV